MPWSHQLVMTWNPSLLVTVQWLSSIHMMCSCQTCLWSFCLSTDSHTDVVWHFCHRSWWVHQSCVWPLPWNLPNNQHPRTGWMVNTSCDHTAMRRIRNTYAIKRYVVFTCHHEGFTSPHLWQAIIVMKVSLIIWDSSHSNRASLLQVNMVLPWLWWGKLRRSTHTFGCAHYCSSVC